MVGFAVLMLDQYGYAGLISLPVSNLTGPRGMAQRLDGLNR
jgi:hypothetical protein